MPFYRCTDESLFIRIHSTKCTKGVAINVEAIWAHFVKPADIGGVQ